MRGDQKVTTKGMGVVTRVAAPGVEGEIRVHKTQAKVEEALAETLSKRFCLVDLSPL